MKHWVLIQSRKYHQQIVILFHHAVVRARTFSRHAISRTNRRYHLACITLIVIAIGIFLYQIDTSLNRAYTNLESIAIKDRKGNILTLKPNSKQEYGVYVDTIPARVAQLLLRKEDHYFYYHAGINPVSILRAVYRYIVQDRITGSSTITQQLVKNLLGDEQDRTIFNKITEVFYTVDLELFTPKNRILTMYANTVYMGNQIQGLSGASTVYFGKPLEDLNDTETTMLLATLSSPSTQNPWAPRNKIATKRLSQRIGTTYVESLADLPLGVHAYSPPHDFELSSMNVNCARTCTTTIDSKLTEQLRVILKKYVLEDWDAGARSGAIVVIKLPENQLLATVGTPDTTSLVPGSQIDMALEPRPIGSTIKPFIYLEGYTRGLRPYTLVDDREYKLPIGTGFPLYPKNYDGQYHGWVTLHAALDNSYNVPSVKTLQYVGLTNFYGFLEHSLGFQPLQDFDTYQYGIALGALEMDPLTLAHFLTIFPEEGTLKPLQLFLAGTSTRSIRTPMSAMAEEKQVADPAMAQLVSRVLNDRLAGVQQFGLTSSLNLPQSNYAVKTGTSENYHDSWTVGYTPDFLVVVWLGNPANTQVKQTTGQSGAGAIWHDSMQLLIQSEYNKKSPLSFKKTSDVLSGGTLDFGLPTDVVREHRDLLPDNELITSPQDGDTISLQPQMTIPLISSASVSWYVDGTPFGEGSSVSFSPARAGNYTIRALNSNGVSSRITLHVIARP